MRVNDVPLIVGVTGHRDLMTSRTDEVRDHVSDWLSSLAAAFPGLNLTLMSPMAAGADLLVAEVAFALDIPVVAVLPMPLELYVKDFEGDCAAQFTSALAKSEVVELPLLAGATSAQVAQQGEQRNLHYAQAGAYVSDHAHVLLALWDGLASESVGGTAQVVRYHRQKHMLDLSPGKPRVGFLGDESGLVYHLICAREDEPEPAGAGTGRYLLTSGSASDLPREYVDVFTRLSEFNEDSAELAQDELSTTLLPESFDVSRAGYIDALYRFADTLAQRFQKRVHLSLRVTYTCAALAGLSFIAYADLFDEPYMMYPYLGFVLLSLLMFITTARGGWHRRYLDYRALAEGLRVQFYACVARVPVDSPGRFGYDTFLASLDFELGWVRHALRGSGVGADAFDERLVDQQALDWTIDAWVDDQAKYFTRQAEFRRRRHRLTSRLGAATWGLVVVAAVLLAFAQQPFGIDWTNVLIALMGAAPLIAALRQNYAHRTAERELVGQYARMAVVFTRAGSLLAEMHDPNAARQLLAELGQAALEEQSQWMARHRERPLGGAITSV